MSAKTKAEWEKLSSNLNFNNEAFIDGKFVKAQSEKTFDCFNPSNGKLLTKVSSCDENDIDLAVKSCRKAFDSGHWSRMAPSERKKILLKLSDLILKNHNELALLDSMDMGKTVSDAFTYDIPGAADLLSWNAEAIDKIMDEVAPTEKNNLAMIRRVPLGVVGAVVPWNYPLAMIGRSLSCSFETGNSTIIKTAELTPLSATIFAKALINAEVPNGLINIICGYGNETGSYLVSHEDVNHVVFTGSVATGKKILHACADKAIPAVVELGGKSAGIVYPDADLNDVLDSARSGIFGVAGQICTAMSRLVVHKSIKDELVDKLVDLSKSLKIGPGIDKDTDLTPVISENQLQKVEGYARSGIQEGAEAAYGGKRVDREGYFMEPTVLNNVKQDMTVAREEIFGPVLSVLEYNDEEEAIKIANDTDYGLGSGVFTKDLKKASWTASKLEAGQVYVNKWFTGNHATPFGGYKQSGYSREKGVDGLKSYLQVKNVGISLV